MSKSKTILSVIASARTQTSVTRGLVADVCQHLQQDKNVSLVERDLNQALPFLNEAWIGANFTAAADRTAEQKQALVLSDTLIDELEQADIIIIGVPIYNYNIPASLKAWIDLICRAKKTFHYTETGPQGLLQGKKAVLVFSSGGTVVGSDVDFASAYLRHVLGFIGIKDITIIAPKIDGQDDADDTARQARLQRDIKILTF